MNVLRNTIHVIHSHENAHYKLKTRYSNRLCKSLLDPKPFTLTSLYVYNPETSKNSFRQKPRAEKQCLRWTLWYTGWYIMVRIYERRWLELFTFIAMVQRVECIRIYVWMRRLRQCQSLVWVIWIEDIRLVKSWCCLMCVWICAQRLSF